MNMIDIISQYYFWPAVFAFSLTVVLCLLGLKVFPKLGLLDRPARYGLKRSPIPYYGGLIIFSAFLISIFVFVPLSRELIGLLIGSFIVVFLGFFDDLLGLSPAIRLFVQFLAALVLVVCGVGILSINLPFLGVLDFSRPVISGIMVLSVFFTIIWVMMVLNTMNFVDGVGGLSSGVAFISALTIFFLSIHPGLHDDPSSQVSLATIALIVACVSLAFLIFDFPKPKMLMGDTGSTFLGFVIATLAIFSGGKVATAFLVLGIPILDMVWVVLRRIATGGKFWQGDLKHLHHRLLSLGLSERAVVLIYLSISAFFGFSAVVLVSSKQKLFMLIALTVLMLLLACALVFIPKKK